MCTAYVLSETFHIENLRVLSGGKTMPWPQVPANRISAQNSGFNRHPGHSSMTLQQCGLTNCNHTLPHTEQERENIGKKDQM